MQLGFTANAPMTYGLTPIRLAQQPPDLPPSRAGGLRVHRQPRTSLTRFAIERAAQDARTQPPIYESTLIPLVHPLESDDALSRPLPPSREELLRGLCPPEAAMTAYALATRAAEIREQENKSLCATLALAAIIRRLQRHLDKPFPPANFSTII